MTDYDFEKRLITAVQKEAGNDNPSSLQRALDEAFDAVKGYIDRSFEALEETLSDVEKRLSAVEAKANREEER